MEKPNLFIAMTPYHILLSIAMKEIKKNDAILLIDEHGELYQYKAILPKIIENFHYLNLNKKSKLSNIINFNLLFESKAKEEITKTIKSLPPIEKIYLFNDNNLAVQYFLSEIGKDKICYIEDGAAPYNDHTIKNSNLKKIAYRLIFGKFYEFTEVLGTSTKISESFFLYPTLARKENRILPHSKYECSPKTKELYRKIFLLHPEIGNLKNKIKDEKISLFLLPRIDILGIDSETTKSIDRLISEESRNGKKILIKRHPLDSKSHTIANKENTIQLPKSLPAEALPAFFERIDSIYSPPNTSLLSFRFLYPKINSFCITKQNQMHDTFCKNLQKIGVKFVH